MERCVLSVFTLLCIYVTFSYAEETIELTESQPNAVRCPDGSYCPGSSVRCCAGLPIGSYVCCPYGRFATCCEDLKTCCPPGHRCIVQYKVCQHLKDSSVLRVQAIPLGNSTDKRCRDGTTGMDTKVSKIIPSQQVETASKKNGYMDTSGNVFSSNEKYQCPDGTSICELSSGIFGCCHLVRGRRVLKHILP